MLAVGCRRKAPENARLHATPPSGAQVLVERNSVPQKVAFRCVSPRKPIGCLIVYPPASVGATANKAHELPMCGCLCPPNASRSRSSCTQAAPQTAHGARGRRHQGAYTKGAAAHGQGGRQRHNGQRSFLFRRALYDTRALGPLGHSRPGAVSGLMNIT